jgi:hypothetical protein
MRYRKIYDFKRNKRFSLRDCFDLKCENSMLDFVFPKTLLKYINKLVKL